MICPLLARHKLDRPTCDFPELCNERMCFWAHFHQVDAHTGKPLAGPPQRDLFDTPARTTP